MKSIELCPKFEYAFELLGKKWTGLIIDTMLNEKKTFSEILRFIPNLSAKMLTNRLKELEKEKIVVRNVYAKTPVKIEYLLTDKGQELKKVMEEVKIWGEKWL